MIFPDTLLLLLTAIAIDAIIGDPRWFYRAVPHPTAVMGWCVGVFDRAFNAPQFATSVRYGLGILSVATLLGVMGVVGILVDQLFQRFSYGFWIEAILISTLISQNSLYRHVADVANAMSERGLEGGRQVVTHIVGRDPETLDQAGVSRAAIESLAENFSDGVVAPVFWGLIFGFPGILAYKALNTADSMIGHLDDKYRHFGWAAARLDDAANYIPARIAGCLITIAGLVAAKSPIAAFGVMARDGWRHRSVNAGYPEAAMAGVLEIRLAGPRQYDGEIVEDPWLGTGRDGADENDIRRALKVYVASCALLAVLIGGGTVFWLPT